MNPAGLVLVGGGIVAIIIGVRGSQKQTWATLFGKSSTDSSSSASVATPAIVPTGPTSSTSPKIPLAPGGSNVPAFI